MQLLEKAITGVARLFRTCLRLPTPLPLINQPGVDTGRRKWNPYHDDEFVPTEDVTLEQLEREFEYVAEIWTKSADRKALFDFIDSMEPLGGWRFDKVVCLGTNSFCTQLYQINDYLRVGPAGSELDGRSMLQFASVVDIANELQKRGHVGESDIQVFAQDPKYVETDYDLITSKGVKALEMKRAGEDTGPFKDHLGPRTFLIEFHVSKYKHMWKDLCENDVGLLVGDITDFLRFLCAIASDPEDADRNHDQPSPEWARTQPAEFYRGLARRIERKYERHKIPRAYEEWNILGGQDVYWPKPQAEGLNF